MNLEISMNTNQASYTPRASIEEIEKMRQESIRRRETIQNNHGINQAADSISKNFQSNFAPPMPPEISNIARASIAEIIKMTEESRRRREAIKNDNESEQLAKSISELTKSLDETSQKIDNEHQRHKEMEEEYARLQHRWESELEAGYIKTKCLKEGF